MGIRDDGSVLDANLAVGPQHIPTRGGGGNDGDAKEIGGRPQQGGEVAKVPRGNLETGILGDENLGSIGQGAGERELVAIEGGEIRDVAIRGAGEAGEVEHLGGAVAGLLDVEAGNLEKRHGNVFRDGEGIEEEWLGEDETEGVVAEIEPGGVIQGTGGLGLEPDLAGIRPVEEAEDAQEHARAGTGRAGEECEAPGLDGEGDAAQSSRGRAVMKESIGAQQWGDGHG